MDSDLSDMLGFEVQVIATAVPPKTPLVAVPKPTTVATTKTVSSTAVAPTAGPKPIPVPIATAAKPAAATAKPAVVAATKPAAVKPVVVPATKPTAAVVTKSVVAVATKPVATIKPIPAPTAEVDSVAESEKFTVSSFVEHAKKKGMWAGALTKVAIPDLVGAIKSTAAAIADEPEDDDADDAASSSGSITMTAPRRQLDVELVDIDNHHTPAVLKIMDEIIVNATDHAKGKEKAAQSQRVTSIKVTYETPMGRVSVFNDGPGLPVVVDAAESAIAGRPVYTPEIAFSRFLAGTNIEKELENVKGGINGLGAKLANVHSVDFVVETVDAGTSRYYRQRWRNRLAITEPAFIVDLKKRADITAAGLTPEQTRPHTRVTFLPAYAELGYNNPISAGDLSDFEAWLRLRTLQAAAYVGVKVATEFNGVRCVTTDVATLGRLLGGGEGTLVLSAQAKATEDPYKQHPWNIAVVVLPPGKKVVRRAAMQNMTIVNGVLSNKGSHILYLKKLLSAAVEDKLRRATKSTVSKTGSASAKVIAAAKGVTKPVEDKPMSLAETLGGVRLVMSAAIPGADWGGQRKDELQVGKDTLERYSLTATFLKQASEAIVERILISQGSKSAKVHHEKYTRARNAGKAGKKNNTYLLAAEGDSAITLLRAGLTQSRKAAAPGGPSLDWCGIISLQGVIVNAAREIKEIETSGGDTINVRSAKLQSNKRLLCLADAFGLRYDYRYETAAERATLNYSKLLLCVDQDLDGTGKIAALVLVWVWLFWPALIREGFVGRFMTPLVRAFPKKAGSVIEFYYETELHAWLAQEPARSETHRIKYYKGLATHDEDEVRRMFTPEAFRASIYTYTMDETANRLFEVYFGSNPALRKEVLITPVKELLPTELAALRAARTIPVGRVQLDIDTKLYKNDAIKRQISGGVDGLNPARRKILMGAELRFGGEAAAKEIKVFQLGGAVADRMFYHHGDASLNNTITYMCQTYAGARKYPYLIGVGQFGSRHGDKAGSPRYISVKMSPLLRATFPPADRWHLRWVFEDGERAEPQWYVPVAPMAALESYRIVSEGWNHDSHGRDEAAVMRIVRAYIAGDPALTLIADRLHAEGPTDAVVAAIAAMSATWPLEVSTRGSVGEVRKYREDQYSFGMYQHNPATRIVVITELPMGVATSKYLETLLKPGLTNPNPRAEFIEDVEDRSTSDSVELHIKLYEGAFEKIVERFGDATIDPVEDCLQLRASLRPHLNYFGVDGGVQQFRDCYLAAILYWAPLRRQLYVDRIERERIVVTLRILEEEQILRYTGIAAELDLARIDDDAVASRLLTARGFPVLHKALLHAPKYTPNADLHRLVTAGPGADHEYILGLSERDLLRSSVARRTAALAKLREELVTVTAQLAERPTPCASVWLTELAEFQAVAARGLATGWKYK